MLNTGQFGKLLQNAQVLNYWLGCAKYWFALGQTYAPASEYPEVERARLEKLGRQPVFSLVLPENERARLMNDYAARVRQPSEVASYPDVVVMPTLLTTQGMKPNPYLYALAYTNEVFRVYAKKVKTGMYAAEPNPKKPQ